MRKILVNETEIQVIKLEEEDYISLTDMVRNIENGVVLIEKWLRNKNTIEFCILILFSAILLNSFISSNGF